MKKRRSLKKGLAIVLTVAMVAGLVPAMSGEAVEVQAATESGTDNTPSVSAYATKEQMMDGTFAPNESGEAENYGKLVFGRKSDGTTAQEWYILGKDEGVSGDNTIIFAASSIATGQVFNSDTENKTFEQSFGEYESNPSDVYPNHYGASALRGVLQSMATDTDYFNSAEQGLMNDTTVTTKDTKNSSVTYTTTDKLYALSADGYGYSYKTLKAGTSDSTVIAMNSYWSKGDWFWLRSPNDDLSNRALPARPGVCVDCYYVDDDYAVQPASNLKLSSVLFASSATAASSDTVSGTIASDTAMTLRFDGTGKNIGTVKYNTTTGDIKAVKGTTSQTVVLVVQGNDGTNDWYYSKKIDESETINVSAIVSESNTPASIDLSTCKIWLEITGNNVSYAVNAEKEIEKINTTYVTKEQLMKSFNPYRDGTATNYGKLVFGKNSSGASQQWYILGKDSGVSGDNTIIFAASPITTEQVFNPSVYDITIANIESTDDRYSLIDTYYYTDIASPETVYANHYGISSFRAALKAMAENTSCFTSAEQGLMNPTTVTTKDMKNSVIYTTTDKLYALAADVLYGPIIKAGSSDSTVLAMSSYWSSGDRFWLRSPSGEGSYYVLQAFPGSFVQFYDGHWGYAVQPASNLNLSSVLFASAATAASSDTAVSGTIASDTAMTLRLDGTGKNIGTALYNTTTGDIKATKGSTEGDVALVVQGKDETNDWYYSKQITGTETINASEIKSTLTLSSDIDLSDCKIWLETTDSTKNLTYAVGANRAVTSVAITGIETPTANTTLDTEALCATTGVSSTKPQIAWTPNDSTAGYNTSYTVSITLTADTGYEFIDSTTATVLGNTATSVTKNADGTLTVEYVFSATAKREIASVTAPTVPTNNIFTTYYGYDGYDASPISGSNSELGTTATVTFEGMVEPTTANMALTWTIANVGGAAYDKTPGATNTFRWTIPASEFADYNAIGCANYNSATETITGTVTITNKAATPVTITGTDSGIAYTGETIDVSQYFDIDTNAGTATYSLITGADGGTGEGSLDGTTLTVTKTGTFKIKVETLANGIYGAGEETITLTVSNGTIEYTATDYSGTYDGQAHNISVNVSNPEGTTITYSTDGITYGSDIHSFTNAGIYTVYYRITKDNYDIIEASKTVTINKKSATIAAENQDIVWGNDIDRSKYTVSEGGLFSGDSITQITLTPSTTAFTENGTISISGVKIENAAGVDVTGNYDITSINGTLKIAHNTTLAPDRIEAVKTKTTYTVGDTLNVDDITVTAHYADGYSEAVTDFTTNADGIDMAKAGDKTLTISYTKNGVTKTKDIIVTVAACTHDHTYVNGVCSVCDKIFEMTVNGITYKVVTETGENGKPVGKVVTVSGNEIPQVAVAVTGTGDDFTEKNPDGKVTIPSEITGSGSEQTFVVTKISDNAFRGASVTEIVVPATVTEVGTGAFGGATTITFKGSTVPLGIAGAITGTGVTVNVPEGAGDSFKAALGDSVTIVEIHTHTTHVKDNGTRVEPTCEKKGSITYKCIKCGEVMEVVELAATGHKWDAGKVTKEATETAEGVKTYTCSVCGKTKTEAIPKKTATTPRPPKKGDVVVDDKGTAKVEVADVTKKEVTYKEPVNKKAKTVTIPATVKIAGVTYKVTKIADNAFKNNKTVTKITIGSNIKTIGKNAFYKCTKLKTVKIGKNVTEIGANAFKGCTSLTSVTLPGKTTKIGANAFNGCKKLKTIEITSTKLTSKTVAKNAFKGLTKATTIKVPKKKLSAYKKLFKQKGLSSKVKVKGY